ncbi:hypothetical protein J6590_049340 [Homalodisca vitripennis]|nr:hypothetical protein J6590_049340 [Homalodisca vitripennis]
MALRVMAMRSRRPRNYAKPSTTRFTASVTCRMTPAVHLVTAGVSLRSCYNVINVNDPI